MFDVENDTPTFRAEPRDGDGVGGVQVGAGVVAAARGRLEGGCLLGGAVAAAHLCHALSVRGGVLGIHDGVAVTSLPPDGRASVIGWEMDEYTAVFRSHVEC